MLKSSGLETKNTLFRLGVKLWIGAKLYLVKSILEGSQHTTSGVSSGSLGFLSLFRRYDLVFYVGIIFSRNVQRYHNKLILNCNTPVVSF